MTNHNYRFISLFSGIGGFEVGLFRAAEAASSSTTQLECLAFSEINQDAIDVYCARHPQWATKNVGDVRNLTSERVMELQPNLVFGGFPCTNLSSAARIHENGNSDGIQQEDSTSNGSNLFFEFLRILRAAITSNASMKFIIENVASMSKVRRDEITSILCVDIDQSARCTLIRGENHGPQARNRYFWTNFDVEPAVVAQTSSSFRTILQPIELSLNKQLTENGVLRRMNHVMHTTLKKPHTQASAAAALHAIQAVRVPESDQGELRAYKFENQEIPPFLAMLPQSCRSRWETYEHHDSAKPCSRTCPASMHLNGPYSILVDRRPFGDAENLFVVRQMTAIEVERLFGLPDDYTNVRRNGGSGRQLGWGPRVHLCGNSVCTASVQYIFSQLMRNG